jgi:hypothetical protein
MNTTVKEIGLFDVIKLIFTDKEGFDKLSNITLKKNYFMCNRIFSIKYPLQGVLFSTMNINESEVLRLWRDFFISNKLFGKVPFWVYTKGSKKSADNTKKDKKVSNQLIKDYCIHYNIDNKDVMDALEFFGDDMEKELKQFEKLISAKNSIKKEKS